MLKIRKLLGSECVRMLLGCVLAAGGGFLLSEGTVSGVVSPLAAALAGVSPPVYSFSVLLGSLGAFAVNGAPESMRFLVASLLCVTCMRILFRESFRPHALGILTALSCCMAGGLADLVFEAESGRLPLYLFEALLTGLAAYFLADAAECLKVRRMIVLGAGRSFTYAVCCLLCITALCALDLPVMNLGRAVGIALTMLAARKFRQGAVCGALSACGVTLCSVQLGMPLLFLPVTGMMAGFMDKLPNAVFIPSFFLMQALSGALFGNGSYLRVIAELLLGCMLYALCSHAELYRIVDTSEPTVPRRTCLSEQEQFLSEELSVLQEETAAVMRRLSVAAPADPVQAARKEVCADCKNEAYCWRQRRAQTEEAFRVLVHTPDARPGALDSCIRFQRVAAASAAAAYHTALLQMRRVQLMQNRDVTLGYLELLTHITADAAKRRETDACAPETALLRRILDRCACEGASCYVYKLRSGRYAAEVYARQEDFPVSTVQELLSRQLGVSMRSLCCRHRERMRICLYEEPYYALQTAVCSLNAPAYERCGDQSEVFTDCTGSSCIVLSDGMGSGSSASLASRIAVRTFRQMLVCGMPAETAIGLINTMLLTETNSENFATLDILLLHADTGELTLYKSGAAATLVRHDGEVQRISGESFPVGIVPDSTPLRRKMTLYAGDWIVMCSDGISEAEYPYIRQLLIEPDSPEQLTRAVCNKAHVFHGGSVRDDITVIAARVTGRETPQQPVDAIRIMHEHPQKTVIH